MTKEISTETLSDGSIDFGNGVIGPSIVDIYVANNAKGSLPATPALTRTTIFEVGALGATSVMVAACGGAETPAQSNQTEVPVVVVTNAPETVAPTAEVTSAPETVAPTAEATPSPEPKQSPTVNPYGKNRTEIFKKIKTQDKKDIEDTSLAELKKAAYKLFVPKYAEIVSQYPINRAEYFTKDLVDSTFKAMEGKSENFKNFMEGYSNKKEALRDYQMLVTSSFIPMALAVCRKSDDPGIQKLSYELADKAWEFGITIDIDKAKTRLNELVQDQIDYNPDW